MKKAIQFNDVLGNKIQVKTVIDTIRQVKNMPCWMVESREVFPQNTNWDYFPPLEGKYFDTDDDAQKAIQDNLLSYIEKSKRAGLGKTVCFEEISL